MTNNNMIRGALVATACAAACFGAMAQQQKPANEQVVVPQVDRRDPPCIGSVIRHMRGDRNGLPAAVQLPVRIGDQNNFQWGGQHAGFLGPKFDPSRAGVFIGLGLDLRLGLLNSFTLQLRDFGLEARDFLLVGLDCLYPFRLED